MRRMIAALAAGALALGALAGTAAAAPKGKAYGKHVQEQCGGLSFGELKELHPDASSLKRGAKHFATTSGGLDVVCTLPPPPAPDPEPEPDPDDGGFSF